MNFKNFRMVHFKCRNTTYPKSNLKRFHVPNELVSWSMPWLEYMPLFFDSDILTGKFWADPVIGAKNFCPKWNQVDDQVNRKSYTGEYLIENNCPKNPEGRTGIRGRGILGRWGPNHAADSIVTRWKLQNNQKVYHTKSKKPILEICLIQRYDTLEWAIPGGMVDSGEDISSALKREFMEETLNILKQNNSYLINEQNKLINLLFQNGSEVYKGYVDDPRNTDNAWIETIAINFHDEQNTILPKLNFEAGDDAKNVCWKEINSDLKLYASHATFLKIVSDSHNANW